MAVFAVLDIVWIGYFFSEKYKALMGPLARLNADGSFNINFLAAFGVYVLLAAAMTLFVIPRISGESIGYAFLIGALMGLIIYGVYDLTNAATLTRWPLNLIIADMAWGTVATGIVAAVVNTVSQYFHWL